MKNLKLMLIALLMSGSLLAVQVNAEQTNTLESNQFPTSIEAEETDNGYRFTLSITNNSGADITVDQMPIFASLFLWDDAQSATYYLRGKNWDLDPKLFASGQTVAEEYEMTVDQLRSLDGGADGKYVFYAVPSLVVNNVYTQLMAVYNEFAISTGEDPPPAVEEPVEVPNNPAMETSPAVSLDINQFETSLELEQTTTGYRFVMSATNNSGTDFIVDMVPIFTNIMLWDEEQQTWFRMRGQVDVRDMKPTMFANGQTIVETFDMTYEILQETTGKVDGKYTFSAVPNIVISDGITQLANVVTSFTVATGEGGSGNQGGGGDSGTVDPGTDERPPLERESDGTASAPNEEMGINFLGFPTEVSTEEMDNGQQRFVMKVTNNSGRDIMVDNLPIFARIIVYDFQNQSWLYLREKTWELKPELFASGTTITETFETKNLAAGKYYFYAVPSIVISNQYTQLMNISAEFELKQILQNNF